MRLMKARKICLLISMLVMTGQASAETPVLPVDNQATSSQQIQMARSQAASRNSNKTVRIKEVEFNESQLSDVVRTLSELSRKNIIATPEAAQRSVTIHLKDVTILDAIKSISRISDLWYRYDEDTDTYRLMTREQYSKDLIVRESENIEIFRLLNANVLIIAQAIEDIYGQRVVLSYGLPAASNSLDSNTSQGSSFGSVRGNNRSVRSSSRTSRLGGSSRSRSSRRGDSLTEFGDTLDSDELTVDRIEQIATAIEQAGGNRIVSQEALQQATIQSQPIYVTVNNEHNMLIVRTDDKAVLAGIQKLIDRMDIPVPQVMLEMRILNVILGEDINSIFNFELQPSGSNQSVNPILLGNNALLNSGTFVYEFLNSRLRANIQFLEERNRIKVLSNPMIVASNHRPAELFIGEEVLLTEGFEFFPAVIDNGIVLQQAFVEADISREDIGITLRITPRINNDGTVELYIEQENSTVNVGGGTIPVGDTATGIVNLPVDTVDTARLTGTVMAKNNLTVAVGGLIRTSANRNERKVPLLGEIPVIGRLFTSTVEGEEETETVLLITPRIMNVPSDSEKIRTDGDNLFYKSHNAGYPEPAEPANRFIEKKEDMVEPDSSTSDADQIHASRQQVYLQMSQYAAEMMRISEIERVRDPLYTPVKLSRAMRDDLFPGSQLVVKPLDAWNRGGMYVTALQVLNTTTVEQPVNYQDIKGRWLASSVENTSVAPKGQQGDMTYMYLISALPFEEVMNDVR
jgi:general secretion pathway protein D